MEIKPSWLLEGMPERSRVSSRTNTNRTVSLVAPHYFKPADLEQLATGEKKMPKVVGSSGTKP